MKRLQHYIQKGKVYRRSDLEYYSKSIDRDLAELTRAGTLTKLQQGLYYAPRRSKFGVVPPDERDVVNVFLKDSDFLMVSPNAYNSLGLGLTQLYNTTWVYNHKRVGKFEFNGRQFEFIKKSAFPQKVSREFLLVDLLNHLDQLAVDQRQTLENVRHRLTDFNLDDLMTTAQQYGTGATKQYMKAAIRKGLEIRQGIS
jgi:hypothetical protein